jgi:methylated-DNA-[protein]-cysteine S-methyltransferase
VTTAETLIASGLNAAAEPSAAELSSLRLRLTNAASDNRLLDVAYTTIETPVGRLLLAATDRGLLRVGYEIEDHDRILDRIARVISPRILRDPRRLERATHQLDEYFRGVRRSFDLPLDLSLSAGFRQTVQRYLPHISYGSTETYGDVAREVGNPRAVRAVGTACATNPLPVVVPCHRVIRSDGTLGGYAGGAEAKSVLLRLESA